MEQHQKHNKDFTSCDPRSGMNSDILCDIYSDLLPNLYSDILSGIYSNILSDIYSEILSGSLFGIRLGSGAPQKNLLFGASQRAGKLAIQWLW